MGQEQRRFARVSQQLSAQCRPYGSLASTWRHVVTVDFSAVGTKFISDELLEPEAMVEFQLLLPGFHEPLVLRGRVIRSQPLPAGQMESAIEFMDVTPEAQERIDQMVRFLLGKG
jgi:hypothetical protein